MFSARTRFSREQNRLSFALEEARAAGREILDLTRSNPTKCGFAYDEYRIGKALSQRGFLRYQPDPKGLVCCREAIRGYYKQIGAEVSAGDLVLTSGTSEGYSWIFRLLCDSGAEVLIPSPGYPLFDFLADLCDVKLVRFPLVYDHGWQIDFPGLAAAVSEQTRAVVVVHPNNPAGHYVSDEERHRLDEFCRERGLALIIDEVFLDFSLTGRREHSFACSDQGLTFTLSGLSKICGLPQMKLAWLAVSGPAAEKREALARLEFIADSYLSVGTPVQLAAPELLAMRDAFQEQVLGRVRSNLEKLDEQLAGQSACERLKVEGGWTAVLRVPALQSDEDLASALLAQHGVLVHPGHFYDFARMGYLVVSLIVPSTDFEEGLRRVLSHFG
jgi:aspartate/methionine/tyrosine aminotransferase